MLVELLERFSTGAGYDLNRDAYGLLKSLRKLKSPHRQDRHVWPWERTVVGVISNSDDRICTVLDSFDLRVNARRVGSSSPGIEDMAETDEEDISFVVCSYDAGYKKPDRRIFDAAKALVFRNGSGEDYDLLYIGDDLQKDVVGAEKAGWDAVLLDREKKYSKAEIERAEAEIAASKGQGDARQPIRVFPVLDI